MSSKANPRRHPNTAFRSIGDDGGLVVLPDHGEVKVLNPVAIRVFELLDGDHSSDQIVATVTDEFEVSAEQATSDVAAFLAELESSGMLAGPDDRGPWEESG